MKKLFFVAVAAIAMLATSCSKDDASTVVGGEKSTVTFAVEAPVMATRADLGDGTTAVDLSWAVYAEDGKYLEALSGSKAGAFSSLKANVEIELVNGKKYAVIFWAQAPGAPYTFDKAAKKVTVADALTSNQEAYDAFYKYETIAEVAGPRTQTIVLTRPFAQLNIATADTQKAADGGLVVKQTKVVVPAYKTLNLVDGSVADEAERTYAMADILTGETIEVGGKPYDLLSMNYILVNTKELEIVKFTVKNGTFEEEFTYNNVPLQRNYKTNIIGNLLTSTYDFTIEINPIFEEPNYEGYYVEDGKVIVASAEGLQAVAEAMANDDDTDGFDMDMDIVLDGDIDLSSLTRAAVSNWKPIGTEDDPFTGTFDGKGYSIKNLNIVETEAKEGKAFIGFFGYAKNVTIKNVVFENVNLNIPCLDIDHSQGHIGAVAGSLEGTSTIENVTVKGDIKVYATQDANGASRVAVVAGGNSYGNVTMKNVHVIANEGSYLIANNNTGALAGQLQGKNVFENCSSNIDVTVNKFFAGGIIGLAAGDSKFVNCHTTGDIAVLAGRSGKAHDHYRVGGIAGGWADGATNVCTLVNCSYTGKLTGVNSDGSVAEAFSYLGYVGRGYSIINGSKVVIDGIEFIQTAPGVYSVTNAEGEEVVAAGSKEDLPKTDDGTMIDTNFDEDTTLFGDITLSAGETNANSGYAATGVKVSNGAVLDGKGHTLTVNDANSTWACCVAVTGGTIKNLTVAGAMRGIFMPGADGDVYIDNVIFKDVVYTFNSDAGNKNYGVYISNCTINGWTSHSDVHKEVVYTNCSFGEGNGYAFARPYGATSYVNCDFAEGFRVDAVGKIKFDNCRLNGVALTADNIATLVTSKVENVVEVK